MLDRRATQLIKPWVGRLARVLQGAGFGANQLTWLGFVMGLIAAVLIANGAYLTGAMTI